MSEKNFSTRIGFLLTAAGCAVGIGNVWRFPYVAGENGGGVFVLFYLLFVLILGMPVLVCELAAGRGGKGNALNAYRALEKPGTKWHLHGKVCIAGCWLLMMYYTTVSGWMTGYFFKYAFGVFDGLDTEQISAVFTGMISSPAESLLLTGGIIAAGFLVTSFGVQKGLERVSKIMMATSFLLIAAMSIHALTLDNAEEGLRFFLMPDWERAKAQGLDNVIAAAMNQSFFTLSVGIGSMELFGSMITDRHTLPGESLRICALDTVVALGAGLIVFPSCFAFGVKPDSGPDLVFLTLPHMFAGMKSGRLWGSLFFLFMTFASFTTVISVMESLISSVTENLHTGRKKAAVLCAVLLFALSAPCALCKSLLQDIRLFGKNIMDMEDYLVSNIILPLGSIVFVLFCTQRFGWGYDRFLDESNRGAGLRFPNHRALRVCLTFVLPVLVLLVFLKGIL